MVYLTDQSLDAPSALLQVSSLQAGAVVMFLGTTRQFTEGRQTAWLEYEGYPPMAEQTLRALEQQARERWPIAECVLGHRLGPVPLGEASVIVAVSTPHRRDAFAAASWLMDQIKEEVPIWKKEHWADGTSGWVHPGTEPLPNL